MSNIIPLLQLNLNYTQPEPTTPTPFTFTFSNNISTLSTTITLRKAVKIESWMEIGRYDGNLSSKTLNLCYKDNLENWFKSIIGYWSFVVE